MKIGACYIRVSTNDQTELSPDSQIKEILKYAKANDINIPKEYIFREDGISGRNVEKRSEFQRMIGTAKTKPKPFDIILVWKFSRFARNREDSILYKSMLRKQLGIDVVSISENIGTDNISILIEALIEAMDEYYSINLSQEVKRGMKEKVEKGGIVSIASFGYKIKAGKFVEDEKTALVLQKIFDDYLNGKGFREIAVELNAKGIRTKRGGTFENRTIEYILNNPVYIGKIRWNNKGKTRRDYKNENVIICDGEHEPLISADVWEAVQKKLAENKKLYAKYERQGHLQQDFMLRGLVKCSDCGSSLTQAVKGISLQCINYAHGRCKTSHSIAINKLNNIVLKKITEDFEKNNFTIVKNKIKKIDNSKIYEDISAEERKILRIMEAYESGVYSIEELKESKNKILHNIEVLKSEIINKKEDSPSISFKVETNLKELLQSEDETEKNLILRQFVDHIIFDRKNNKITIFYY